MNIDTDRYRRFFSEGRFWQKLSRYAQQAGVKVVYAALLLYFAYQRKETPSWAKRTVIGTLGYFLFPLDFLPDLTPFIGYTDDLGLLTFCLVALAGFINDDVRQKARTQLNKLFDQVDPELLAEVDEKL